jgi:hypothetical protein
MENLNSIRLFLNRIYYFLFVERYNKKLDIKFPKNIYRWDLIQHIIDKYSFKNYLEIGCDKNQSFSRINVKNKVGVDPVSGGTIRDTSDNFFRINKDKYDIIFIDGLHHYEQVSKDIKNSLEILNQNGFILIHDCLPRSIAHQAIPRYRGSWNGDVWKSIVEMRTLDNIETYTCQIDFGVGVIRNIKNSDVLKINLNDFSKLKFKDYYHNYKEYMRVVDYENFLDII